MVFDRDHTKSVHCIVLDQIWELRVSDRGLTTGRSASEVMQKQIIKDNKHNGSF